MTEHRKNYYEELIDKMMIDEVLNEEVHDLLQNNPNVKKKRIAILSALEDNNKQKTFLFNKIKSLINNNDVTATQHIQEVVTMLRDYVAYGDVEKKKFGEVMTPISLVEEMLDTLPKEVWSNPDLKWLDPANGVGIFPAIVVQRLMDGLKEFEPCEEKRYAHIMENMIYVCELQPKNMFLYLCGFDPEDKYELNIYSGSFLDNGFDEHMSEVYGIEKFDVIVMNPPYQEKKEGFNKSKALWHDFVSKTINKLSKDGYLVAIHPDGWRSSTGRYKKVQTLLKNRQVLYLELHDVNDGAKMFGAGTPYDFYCVKNTFNINFKTKIKFADGDIRFLDISKLEFIPNGMFNVYQMLIDNSKDKLETISDNTYESRKNTMSHEKTDEFHLPCVYTTYKDESIRFMYSSINNGHFEKTKLIWSNGRATSLILDECGQYGMTQFSYAIVDTIENLIKIKAAMETPKFGQLMNFSSGVGGHKGGQKYNFKVIKMFKNDFWKEFINE